jgi:hypothetical protein
MWLRDGFWMSLPIEPIWRYCGLAYPDLHWKGAQIIVAGMLDLPIAFVSILLACLVVLPEYMIRETWTSWDDAQTEKRIQERMRREEDSRHRGLRPFA